MATTKITTPELFDFSATNTALQLPTGTTAQRPTSPSAGEWRFNTTEKYVEYWDGSAWKQIDTEAPPNPDDFPSQNFNVNTYTGTGATQTIDAKFNEAANFNGSSSLIALPESSVISQQNNFTLSFWVKPNGFVAFGTVLTLYSDYRNYVDIRTNGILGFDATGSQVNTPSSSITDGVWQHIAITKSSTAGTVIYVNGTAVVTDASDTGNASDFTSNSYPNTVGAYKLTGSASDFFPGSIDQVRIFNTVLPATGTASIATLYAETTTTAATLNFPVGAGCIAAYQLDGDASDVGGTYGGVTTDIGYTGLRFQPDFIWIKDRDAANWHNLQNTLRGATKHLYSNATNAEDTTSDGLTSFDSDGFTIGGGGGFGNSGNDFVAWCWKAGGAPTATNSAGAGNIPTAGSVKIDGADLSTALAGTTAATKISANTKAGFSIVEFSGNLSSSGNIQVGHGLSSPPELIIQKNINGTGTWWARPFFLNNNPYQYLGLSENAALVTSSSSDGTMAVPTSTTFDNNWNTSLGSSTGVPVIAYCFHSVAGYQKVGSYTGNNGVNTISTEITSGDGGVEPAFLLIKNTTAGSTNNWIMVDNKRSPANQRKQVLNANLADAESTETVNINFLTNGFQLTNGNSAVNQNGDTYIYLAIAADKDTSVPTQANSFSPTLYTGNGGTQSIDVGLKPDFVWVKDRDNNATSHTLADSVRGVNNTINSNTTGGQYNNTTYQYNSFDNDGFTVTDDNGGNYGVNGNGINYVSWNWKAGGLPTINSDGNITSIVSVNDAAGFSIVRYVGNEQASQTIGHGLSNSPEIAFIKQLDGGRDWIVPLFTETSGDYLELNDTAIKATDTNKWSAVSADTFTVGADPYTNGVGSPYIGYFFTSITGYQKVGSYTANGSTTGPIVYTTDDGTATGTGGFEPRYLLIKSADNASTNWIILDKARTPNNPMEHDLKANSAAVEQTGTGNNYPQATTSATGFQVNTTDGAVNGSGTYIYLAIA